MSPKLQMDLSKCLLKSGVMPHACDPRTWRSEARELPRVQSQSRQHHEFQASLGYRVRPCLRIPSPPSMLTCCALPISGGTVGSPGGKWALMSDTECVTKLGVGPKERGGIGEQAAVGTSLRLSRAFFIQWLGRPVSCNEAEWILGLE